MRNRSHRQEVKTIAEYITTETIMPPFFRYPRFLLKMDLPQTAKLLYALLLDRSALSQKNGWQDSEGRTYIVYPITEIAEILDKSTMTIQSALNELDAAGLLERERRGFSNTAMRQWTFEDLKKKKPNHFAVRQYAKFKLAAAPAV